MDSRLIRLDVGLRECERCRYPFPEGDFSPRDLIIFLGAGASVDAGVPAAIGLAQEVCAKLLARNEIKQRENHLLQRLMQDLAQPTFNIEDLLYALSLVGLGSPPLHLHSLLKPEYHSYTREASRLGFEVWRSVIEMMTPSLNLNPGYLRDLAKLKPANGPLDVFSLNFDLCVEQAMRDAGVRYSTGFINGVWNAAELEGFTGEVRLHKLHGSINWYRPSPAFYSTDVGVPFDLTPYEAMRGDFPDVVLGFAEKTSLLEPFRTLWAAFVMKLHAARNCVVIGYSFGDPHINVLLQEAQMTHGMDLVIVTPGFNSSYQWEPSLGPGKYHIMPLFMGAKEALEGSHVLHALCAIHLEKSLEPEPERDFKGTFIMQTGNSPD